MVGVIPHVVGLGGQWDNITDNGFDPKDGSMGGGTGGQNPNLNDVVIQADSFDEDNNRDHWQIKADKDTGDTTIEHNPPVP